MKRALLVPMVLWAASAAADPAPMSAGRQPAPVKSSTIRIAREVLTIDLDRKASSVKAILELENGGPATRLDVGFPCDPRLDETVSGLECKTRLDVRIDGKKQKARRKGKHWVWPMRFAEGQKVVLEVAYRSPLRNDRYENPYAGMGALTYRLLTGATWAGPIGELEMTVNLPTDTIAWIAPAGYTRERGRVTWKLASYEPTSDLAIFFPARIIGLRDVTPEERKEVARELRADTHVTEWVQILHRVTGKTLTLPAPSPDEVAATVEASARFYEAAP